MSTSVIYDTIPRFSWKILLFSLAVLAASFFFFGVRLYGSPDAFTRAVSPRLLFASGQEVMVQTVFDADFVRAVSDQNLRTGTRVKTGEGSFAQVSLDDTVLRLDQNTEVLLSENAFSPSAVYDPQHPRLTFQVFAGTLWVSAREPMEVRGGRHAAVFTHSVGSFTYADPLNRIVVITGGAEVRLRDADGAFVARYFTPSRYQVTFTDDQVTPAYARLQPSKLRKELKLGALPSSVLEDEWVQRNLARDAEVRDWRADQRLHSRFAYRFRDTVLKARAALSWLPAARTHLAFSRIQARLDYLFGFLHENNLKDEAGELLKELDAFALALSGDPSLRTLFTRELYGVSHVPFGSPAGETKAFLRRALLDSEGPALLRTALANIESDLSAGNFTSFKAETDRWLAPWTAQRIKAHPAEFLDQSALYHSLVLTHAGAAPETELIAGLDKVSEARLEAFPDDSEVLFAVIRERLDIAGGLTAESRAAIARQYLKTAYTFLDRAEASADPSALLIFRQQADLLKERIAFAEQDLHGAADAETGFRDYLQAKARDKTLSDSLQSILETGNADSALGITSAEVARRFNEAGIHADEADIVPLTGNPFAFSIKNARLFETAPDGSLVHLAGVYDFVADSLHEIMVNGTPLPGAFELRDLTDSLTGKTPVESPSADAAVSSAPSLDTGLFLTEDDAASRSELQARDLAMQLALEALREAGITASDAGLEVQNESTLSEFRVTGARVDNGPGEDPLSISFDLNLTTRQASRVAVSGHPVSLPGPLALSALASAITEAVRGGRLEESKVDQAYAALLSKGLVLDRSNLVFDTADRVRFSGLRPDSIPLSVDGVYDAARDVFAEAGHALLRETDIAPAAYFDRLIPLYTADFLQSKGLSVDAGQVAAPSPYNAIRINGYAAGGSTFSFEIDFKADRVKNISVEGSDAHFPSLTFREFADLISRAR